MHCIDDTANPAAEPAPNGRLGRLSLLFTLVAPASWLAACSSPMPPPVAPPAAAPRPWPNAAPRPPAPATSGSARNWDEYRQRAAMRLVSANPDITYTGAVPEPLLAIPVLSVELHSDGSIAKIDVMRYPSQAKDTTQIAIDAVRRAAPFGYVGNLPKPWKYVETFLFDDNRRFKPVTLDR
ncbi:MAG: hypothetical protein U1F53_20675 [Burkholderiaceae bacterium]